MQDKVKRDMGDLSNGLDFSNLPDSLYGLRRDKMDTKAMLCWKRKNGHLK